MLKWLWAYSAIWLSGSWARLACSYFPKAQPCGPDFAHRNWTHVNTCCLLLSSFVHFHVRVEVSCLIFAIGNFRPFLSEFVLQHVTAAVRLKQQSASSKKAVRRKKESKSSIWKSKETENCKTLGSELPVVKSIGGSLKMRLRAASVIIVWRWMHNLQVGGNWGPQKLHCAWTLRQDCTGKEGPKPDWWSSTSEVAYATAEREDDSSKQQISLPRRQGGTQTLNKLGPGGGGGILSPISHICLCLSVI